MLSELRVWSQKINAGLDIAHNFHFKQGAALPSGVKKIAFVGMGGSGIAGQIIATFLEKRTKVASCIIDGPVVPQHVDTGTLAVVISYSGNTWETIAALDELVARGVPTLVLAHGGRAAAIAEERNLPLILLPQSKTPRSALGSMLGILLGLFDLMGILNGKEILAAFQRQIALYVPKFEDRTYFAEFLRAVGNADMFHVWGVRGDSAAFAYRSQTQFNENSKIRAVFSPFPELCHNLLVGFTQPHASRLVLFFRTAFVVPSIEQAAEATAQILKEQGAHLYNPPVLGDTWDEQLFHIILWSDFASCYLGEQRGVEITPVKLIDALKEKHKKMGIS